MSESISNASVFSEELRIVLSRVVRRLNTLTGDYTPQDPIDPEEPDPVDPDPEYGMEWEYTDKTDPTGERDPGFYRLDVYSDTRKIYLANYSYVHEGVTVVPSDNNSGLSILAPRKTPISATTLLEAGKNCILYIRSDENHEDFVWDFNPYQIRNKMLGGESLEKPMAFVWYGDPEAGRPKVIPPQTLDRAGGHSYLWFDGLHFYAPKQVPGDPQFSPASELSLTWSGKGSHDCIIQDCESSGVKFVVQSPDNTDVKNFIFHRNIGHFVYYANSSANNSSRPSFSYTYQASAITFTENIMKWSGWHPEIVAGWVKDGRYLTPEEVASSTAGATYIAGAGANQFNHALYMGQVDNGIRVDDIFVKHNIMFEPSAHSWQLRGGGTAECNISIGQSIGPTYGYINPPIHNGANCISRRNIVLKTRAMYKMSGGCQGGTCTPAVWGFSWIIGNKTATFLSENDILAHRENNASDPSLLVVREDDFAIPESSLHMSETTLLANYPSYAGEYTITGRKTYHFTDGTQGDDQNYVDPDRDLGKYFSVLTGETVTDIQAIEFLESRPKCAWDEQYSPVTIHAWIEKGFDIAEGGE